MAVFTWERITFRKTFRIAIQNVIGIVIWTTCVHMTCIANAFPITIRICALRGNILFLLRIPRWLTHAWFQHGFSANFQNAHARITFRKSFAFTCPRIRLSTRITIQITQKRPFFAFQNAFQKPDLKQRSWGLKSGFQIRKGPNHVPKRLSERDSFSCEQAHNLPYPYPTL